MCLVMEDWTGSADAGTGQGHMRSDGSDGSCAQPPPCHRISLPCHNSPSHFGRALGESECLLRQRCLASVNFPPHHLMSQQSGTLCGGKRFKIEGMFIAFELNPVLYFKGMDKVDKEKHFSEFKDFKQFH